MEDISGVGKVADSKLANSVYDDAVSPAAKELGKVGEDVTKTLRLFTAPFQLAAVAQDRFEIWLNEVRRRVPLERQVEARSHVAGPALRAMLFMDEANPLAAYFLNLLSHAIDKETANDVHPAFVNVLEQICPQEAVLLKHYYQSLPGYIGHQLSHHVMSENSEIRLESYPVDISSVSSALNIRMYIDHLCTLGLLAINDSWKFTGKDGQDMRKEFPFWHGVTEFGRAFCTICIQPDNSTKA